MAFIRMVRLKQCFYCFNIVGSKCYRKVKVAFMCA